MADTYRVCSANEKPDNDKPIKCVVVGDNTVGKTCLLLQMSYTANTISRSQLESFASTYIAKLNVNGKVYQLELLEAECTDSKETNRSVAYEDTDVFCLCFSVADRESFLSIKEKWHREIKQFSPHSPIVLVGTKVDLRDSDLETSKKNEVVAVSFKEGKKLAKRIGARKYVECSALKQRGYSEVFNEAIKAVISSTTKKSKCVLL